MPSAYRQGEARAESLHEQVWREQGYKEAEHWKSKREEKQEGSKDRTDQSKSNKWVGGTETWKDKQQEPADTMCEKGRG